MKRMIVGGSIALLLAFVWLPRPASALSISADIPIVYGFSEAALKDPEPSGLIVGVSLPFLLGFGFESYEVTGKFDNAPAADLDFTYDVTMLDVFVDIPFPAANLVLGAGIGRGEFDLSPATGQFSDATLTQLFISIGIPFAVLFDAHVSYHAIQGEADVSGGTPLNLDGDMATIGIKIGF